ncbi:hypothetical protein [Nostoc sp. FACHB-110]|nr:hypothetical protein [Nostoc sp. FACHB-110]MBD2436007.1 hypothetical protein [Nostoc sp. FACHB-110]
MISKNSIFGRVNLNFAITPHSKSGNRISTESNLMKFLLMLFLDEL